MNWTGVIPALTTNLRANDAIVEGIRLGAQGWVAGLVNAFPAESVAPRTRRRRA